jgi:hypothetical protein
MTPDELASVLAEIAEIEATPGFDGPRIWGKIQIFRKQAFQGGWSQDHLEDRIVGEIGRAVKAHRNPDNHLKDWMIDIEDGGCGQFVVYIKDRIGHKIGVGQGPLALAALLAWEAAIGGGETDAGF